MAIVNYSPWADAANVGQGLGSSLTNLMIQLPAIRQQQLLNQAHMGLFGAEAQHAAAQAKLAEAQAASEPITSAAHAGYYNAEANRATAQQGLYTAQTGEISKEDAGIEGLAKAYRGFANAKQMGLDPTPFIPDIVENLARLPHNKRAQLGEQFAQAMNAANPAFQQQLGLGQHGIVPVASQGGLYDVVGGKMITQEPQKLGYGQNLVDQNTGEVLGQGRDRPLTDALHSAAIGAAGRAYFDPFVSDAKRAGILKSMPTFFNSLPGLGMPGTAPPIVPGRGTNAPPAGVPAGSTQEANGLWRTPDGKLLFRPVH